MWGDGGTDEGEAEHEESHVEQVDRLRADWEGKRIKLAPLQSQGLRAGDGVYDFALQRPTEAEEAWRATRGPPPVGNEATEGPRHDTKR